MPAGGFFAVAERFFLGLIAFASSAMAVAAATSTDFWTNPAGGSWAVASNWSSNTAPNSTFASILITNANTKTVTADATTPAINLSVQRLTVSGPPGTTNTLALVDLAANVPLQLSGALIVGGGGWVTLTNSTLTCAGLSMDRGAGLNLTNSTLRQGGFTLFDIINGNAWLDGGLIDCGAIQSMRLGRTNNASGTLTLNGGALLAPELQIGASTGARGALTVAGGTASIASMFTTGYGVNSTGAVTVSAGELIATNDITYVGKSGFGQMSLSGGRATFAFLSVGNNAGGEVSVTGGQLTVKPRSTNDWTQIGYLGAGRLNLSGGNVTLLSEFHIGDDSSGFGIGSGVVEITGGQLIATNDLTAVGRYSSGQMIISNATAYLTNVSIGRHEGSVGTLDVQSNGQLFLFGALSIGRFSNSVGHILVDGGLLSLTNDSLWVGREGTGDLTISSGAVHAQNAFVALSTVVTDPITQLPVTTVPSGTLTLNGGTLLLTSNLLVGSSSISTGQVTVAGGSLILAGNGNSASLSVSSGAFNFSGGTVTTDNLFLTNSSGQFIFSGGTLQARSITASNGAPFIVGNGVDAATLQLQGGTYLFADGLVISSHASVTGCGTILGNVTNLGTLATNCPPDGITITAISRTGDIATIFFTTLASSNHVVEYKDALANPVWTAILPGVIGNGQIMSETDTNAAAPSRFYRIHLP